jgi:hypothetical protein
MKPPHIPMMKPTKGDVMTPADRINRILAETVGSDLSSWEKHQFLTAKNAAPNDRRERASMKSGTVSEMEKVAPTLIADEWCADDVREFRCIGKAISRAATDLPKNWGIRISLELGAGTVYLSAPDGAETMIDMSGEAFSDQISAAIDHARRIEREGE